MFEKAPHGADHVGLNLFVRFPIEEFGHSPRTDRFPIAKVAAQDPDGSLGGRVAQQRPQPRGNYFDA